MLALVTTDISAQAADGSATAAVAGGALGLASGATLGFAASVVPCTQTYVGAACVRWGSAVGGAIMLSTGVLIGTADQDQIENAATTAGIGATVGVAAGLALTPFAQRIGWRDVTALGLLGGAVGAAPRGAAIGAGIGGAVGAVLWQTVPEFNLPDAMGAAVAGLAVGAMVEWVWTAIEANTENGAQILVPMSLWF